ncbi:ATP-binding protein [Actinomadura sp. DC4]|uniref:ATP-binding protein n=1 Tax=Actinomadura sp. DC4 TaxID=3055069 RepID=UPI0025B08DBA|nr:ATP-binding protein [Actinomadura sp. DC4]MDN3357951.1 ATP-binding protein [Actinomadura sp. DC4]
MKLSLVLCLPRDAETVRVTRNVLDASLAALEVTADIRDDIALALGEACANVIEHADSSDEYEVRVQLTNWLCVVEVVDTGRGFDSASLNQSRAGEPATAEHGRGLQIIDALAENLQITSRPLEGAMIRFEKPLQTSVSI